MQIDLVAEERERQAEVEYWKAQVNQAQRAQALAEGALLYVRGLVKKQDQGKLAADALAKMFAA